ncbi:MAG: hypothetical protein MZV64_25150 [Ignavibacteriales bacterium]|nr:hypothetical protein [Ignavibacteriales bacterium]
MSIIPVRRGAGLHMSFTSHLFLLAFLPLAVLLHWVAPARLRNGVLAAASLVFLAWAGPVFLLPLLVVAVVDWGCGRLIAAPGPDGQATLEPGGARTRRQRLAFATSLTVNLGLLAGFKLMAPVLTGLANLLGLSWAPAGGWQVAVPLGLSFYTFQSLSHTIDVFRGHTPACRRFVDYLAYLAAFPRLVAGPIVRFHQMAERLAARRFELEGFARGCLLFSLGLGKKVLLANPLGEAAGTAFAAGALSAGDAWFGLLGVRLPDLPRLLGLHRHGAGARPHGGARAAAQLRRSVPLGLGHRVLAALAHHALVLAAGLRVPAGGLRERPAPGPPGDHATPRGDAVLPPRPP